MIGLSMNELQNRIISTAIEQSRLTRQISISNIEAAIADQTIWNIHAAIRDLMTIGVFEFFEGSETSIVFTQQASQLLLENL